MDVPLRRTELVHLKKLPSSLYANNNIMIIRVPPQLQQPGFPSFLLASDIFRNSNGQFNWPGNSFLSKILSTCGQLPNNMSCKQSSSDNIDSDSLLNKNTGENSDGLDKYDAPLAYRDLSPLQIEKSWIPAISRADHNLQPDLRTLMRKKRNHSDDSPIVKMACHEASLSHENTNNLNKLLCTGSPNKLQKTQSPLLQSPIKRHKIDIEFPPHKRLELSSLNRIHPLLDGTPPIRVKHAVFVDVDNCNKFVDRLDNVLPEGTHIWITYCDKTFSNYVGKLLKILPIYCIHQHQQCGTLQGYAITALTALMEILHKELPISVPFTIISPENLKNAKDNIEGEGRDVYQLTRSDFDQDVLQKHFMSDH